MTHLRQETPDPLSGKPCWTLCLGTIEATVVCTLPERLESLLSDPGQNVKVIRRLFPANYEDAAEEAESRRMLGKALLDERRELLVSVRALLAQGVRTDAGLSLPLSGTDVDLWLRFVNDMRLVLATELDVEQSMDVSAEMMAGPDGPSWALLEYLGGLQSLLLSAVATDLGGPFATDEPDDDLDELDEPENHGSTGGSEDADS